MWGTIGGICGANYAWYFLLIWLPSYLVRERHFSLAYLATFGSLPYLFMAISSVSGGAFSDYLIKRGHDPVFRSKGIPLDRAMRHGIPSALRLITANGSVARRALFKLLWVWNLRFQPVLTYSSACRKTGSGALDGCSELLRQCCRYCKRDLHRLAGTAYRQFCYSLYRCQLRVPFRRRKLLATRARKADRNLQRRREAAGSSLSKDVHPLLCRRRASILRKAPLKNSTSNTLVANASFKRRFSCSMSFLLPPFVIVWDIFACLTLRGSLSAPHGPEGTRLFHPDWSEAQTGAKRMWSFVSSPRQR